MGSPEMEEGQGPASRGMEEGRGPASPEEEEGRGPASREQTQVTPQVGQIQQKGKTNWSSRLTRSMASKPRKCQIGWRTTASESDGARTGACLCPDVRIRCPDGE